MVGDLLLPQMETPVMVKKAVIVVVVLFLGFWMFTDPHGLAHATRSSASETWNLSEQLFTALIKFLRDL
jgi:hypothetical protein